MQIDWMRLTPGAALAGGMMIGFASVALALLLGRIAGISGIVGGLFSPRRGDAGWRIAFLLGLLAAPAIYSMAAAAPAPQVDASAPLLVAAGLLVGFGARYGSGCTSGHGVCGLSRLSPRSLVATFAFMAAGMASVFVVRHVLS